MRIWLGDYGSPLRDSARCSTAGREQPLPDEHSTPVKHTFRSRRSGERRLSTQESNVVPGCPYFQIYRATAQTTFSAEPLRRESATSNLKKDQLPPPAGDNMAISRWLRGCQRLSAPLPASNAANYVIFKLIARAKSLTRYSGDLRCVAVASQ